MATENSALYPDNKPSFPTELSSSPLHSIFYNDSGLRSGWGVLIYIVLIVVLAFAMNLVLDRIFHVPKASTPGPGHIFLQEFLLFILVFLPACFLAWVGRP